MSLVKGQTMAAHRQSEERGGVRVSASMASTGDFSDGDRVVVHGEQGVILRRFPDGISWVRLDDGRIIAAQALELTRPREDDDV